MENEVKDVSSAAPVAEQPAVKKAAAKKAPAKKSTAKKVSAKKATAKKATAKKATPREVSALSPKKVVPPASAPSAKGKKVKLVRDSFTMPANEYQTLQDIKKASLKAGVEVKKSELLRIGVGLLKTLSVAQIDSQRAALIKLRAGRPKK